MARTGRPTNRPPREELEDLYAYDRQNKRIVEIAAHYHVSRDTAKDWLSHYGITKRPMPDKVAGHPATQRPQARVVAQRVRRSAANAPRCGCGAWPGDCGGQGEAEESARTANGA